MSSSCRLAAVSTVAVSCGSLCRTRVIAGLRGGSGCGRSGRGSPGAPGAAERAGRDGALLERLTAGGQRGALGAGAEGALAGVGQGTVRVTPAGPGRRIGVRLVPDRLVRPRLA